MSKEFKIKSLDESLKESGISITSFCENNNITLNGSLKLRKTGAVVIGGKVYRPTKYTVGDKNESNSNSKEG